MISVTCCRMRQLGVFADRAHLLAQLERLGVLDGEVEFLLQLIGVLVAAHADVAGEEWNVALARC